MEFRLKINRKPVTETDISDNRKVQQQIYNTFSAGSADQHVTFLCVFFPQGNWKVEFSCTGSCHDKAEKLLTWC
jgi:hypothetical protein